jgi:hypothetical protein
MKDRYLPILGLSLFLTATLVLLAGILWTPANALVLPDIPTREPGILIEKESGADKDVREYKGAPAAPSSSGVTDQFGYRLDDTIEFSWLDIVTATVVITGGVDDIVVGPISLGFPFKFYENEYEQIYISSNGLLGFDESLEENSAAASNIDIPLDYEYPQNIIAPFWDDLRVGIPYNSGAVYYDRGSDEGRDYFVVEWHQVSSIQEAGNLTFEVILFEDGDIVFQYGELDGPIESATVGIEDGDGLDGIRYLFNSTGLEVDKDVYFERPEPSWRVKVFPHYQGSFNIDRRSSFEVFIRNTGELGIDNFNLSTSLSQTGWNVSLEDQDGKSITNTGPLNPGETFKLTVSVSALAEITADSQMTVTLKVVSANDPGKAVSSRLVSAIPTNFGLIYREGQPLKTEFISPSSIFNVVAEKYYTANSFALGKISDEKYIAVWEVNESGYFTNIKYLIMNGAGIMDPDGSRYLTQNFGTGVEIRDNKPVVATNANGTTGVVWVRSQFNYETSPVTYNDNVYFARLDQNGDVLDGEIQVTDNDVWASSVDPRTSFDEVRIVASAGNQFHISWTQIGKPIQSNDIGYAVYGESGDTPLKSAFLLTDGVLDDTINYSDPVLISYNSQVLLLYLFSDQADPNDPHEKIVYVRLENDGDLSQAQTDLFDDLKANGLDGIQLISGSLALTWTNYSNGNVVCAMIDDLASPSVYTELSNPDGRSAASVSVTGNSSGQAVLTWIDGDWSQRMYYALLDPEQGLIVQPITFKYSPLGGSTLEANQGWGIAFYIQMFKTSLPIVIK